MKTARFVTFYSPGTFVAEETRKPISSWDVEVAQRMAASIVERYDAHPYAFRFSTRTRGEDDLDSRETARSGLYFIGCRVLTKSDLDPVSDRILIANMECNGWDRVAQTTSGWKFTQPLMPGDEVLPAAQRSAKVGEGES